MRSWKFYLLRCSIELHKFLGKSKSGRANYVNSLRSKRDLDIYSSVCVSDYVKYLEKSRYSRILEVGTGSTLLTAFYLRNHGDFVHSIDKYNGLLSLDGLYNDLGLDDTERASLEFISSVNGVSFKGKNVNYDVCGLESFKSDKTFDLVVSRAVFEHLDNVELSLSNLANLLSEEGEMIHEIDFRDHGLFTHFGLNDGFFYSLSKEDWNYAMDITPGLPNRYSSRDFEFLFRKYFPNKVVCSFVKVEGGISEKYTVEDESRKNRVVVFHIK